MAKAAFVIVIAAPRKSCELSCFFWEYSVLNKHSRLLGLTVAFIHLWGALCPLLGAGFPLPRTGGSPGPPRVSHSGVGQWRHSAGRGNEPRKVFIMLRQISLVDVVLPTRTGHLDPQARCEPSRRSSSNSAPLARP
jgi:hypothetical protein